VRSLWIADTPVWLAQPYLWVEMVGVGELRMHQPGDLWQCQEGDIEIYQQENIGILPDVAAADHCSAYPIETDSCSVG
jgi:hypothetical protein